MFEHRGWMESEEESEAVVERVEFLIQYKV